MSKKEFFSGGAAHSSKKTEWRTPKELFTQLDTEFKFTLDAAADNHNHLCERFINEKMNALVCEWNGRVFLNPPYSRDMYKWIRKAHEQVKNNFWCEFVVALIPARTDTKYWHEFIEGKAEVRFIKGRLKYWLPDVKPSAAPFPSCIVIWHKKGTGSLRGGENAR